MARIVIALGGNALQTKGAYTAEAQLQTARITAVQIVDLVELGHEVVLTHGNGPQVGDILLGEEASAGPTNAAMPLDVCVAMSQGQIGYWLQQALGDELRKRKIDRDVATVVTQVVVDADDKAFADPSKPIGQFYEQAKAGELAAANGWVVKEDAGRGWRRMVASPKPADIVEINEIKELVESGSIVIACGGGGIPVVRSETELRGVEAVIDKDYAAAKLADGLGAHVLMILTAVEAVSVNFQKPDERSLGEVSVDELAKYAAEGQFAPGSMLPKVEASMEFVKSGVGLTAVVTSLEKAKLALAGEAGTHIVA